MIEDDTQNSRHAASAAFHNAPRLTKIAQAGMPVSYTHLGIGLSNVDERMRLHYGNEYGLTIESAPGTGTQCILRIPNEAIR